MTYNSKITQTFQKFLDVHYSGVQPVFLVEDAFMGTLAYHAKVCKQCVTFYNCIIVTVVTTLLVTLVTLVTTLLVTLVTLVTTLLVTLVTLVTTLLVTLVTLVTTLFVTEYCDNISTIEACAAGCLICFLFL